MSDKPLQIQKFDVKPFNKFLAPPYDFPANAGHWRQRLERNIASFQSNYIVLICVGLALYSYIFPRLLIFLSIGTICIYLSSRIDEQGFIFDNLQVNGYVFSKNEKFQILVGVSIFALLSSGSLFLLLWGSAAPIFACIAHASMKQTSLSSKARHKLEKHLDQAEDSIDNTIGSIRKKFLKKNK
mmetsp:Transcript_22391/g.37949  ORF Transcript_22391/g.37949 Transcript_22391/m.37949 type:complete len:184 (+) Transcript_22391:78-629(+)